jgi:hypothetical protein
MRQVARCPADDGEFGARQELLNCLVHPLRRVNAEREVRCERVSERELEPRRDPRSPFHGPSLWRKLRRDPVNYFARSILVGAS